MPLKCIILDDDLFWIKILEKYLSFSSDLELVDSFQSPQKALEAMEALDSNIDFLILNVEMPYLSGFEFLDKLSHPPKVIFTSSNAEHLDEALKKRALDFLVKPISQEDFEESINKLKEDIF